MEKIWLIAIILVVALIATFVIGFWAWIICAAFIIGKVIIKAIRK